MDKKISLKTNSRDINSLIQFLLKKFTDTGKDIIHYHELKKEIDLGISPSLIAEELKYNPKIHFDEIRRQFTLKKKYLIHNKQELIDFLQNQHSGTLLILGLELNNDLFESYRNIQQDIESLKNEKKIRCIETKNPGKKMIIFAKDPKYDYMDLEINDTLKNIFISNLDKIQELFPSKMIQLEEQIKKEKTKNQKKKLRQYQVFNEWMKDKINFAEVIQAKEEEYKQYLNSRKINQSHKNTRQYKSKFIKK